MTPDNNLNIDLSLLDGLTEEEKKVALDILKQYATEGKSDIYDELQNIEWDEIPVDIHTFMHDKQYLGNALYDPDGRFTVFPYWEKCLEDIFPTNTTTKYNTIVFTGAIGLGKSTIAVICLLYMLYRLLCLKDPYQYYGMQSIDKLSISLMNITIENARGVALDKLNQMLLASEWFMAHGEMHGTTNLKYVPEKHIELICASSNNQIIGRALFANFTDEVNFALVQDPEKQKKRMMKMITQIDARMKSRFMRGTYLPTLNIVASSKDSEQSFLEAFIKNKRDNENKNTLIIEEAQWVVDPRKGSPNDHGAFWVAVGNKLLANELLPLDITEEQLDEFRNKGYDLWKVPPGYLDTFQLNLDEAICSIIGIATASTIKYISGTKLLAAKTDEYKNPFINDILKIGDAQDDILQYSNYFDLTAISPKDRARPMFIHLDMSTSGDKTGIAGVWITGKEATANLPVATENSNLLNYDNELDARSLSYKLAFSVSIEAPKGARISFKKHIIFIRWLREQGFVIKGISADTFQSASTLQDLAADGFKTETISVDRLTTINGKVKICLPYHYFRDTIYERRIKIYSKCDLLTEELLGLERESDGRINHPDDGKHGSKDQSDAVCGALYLASKYAIEYGHEYGEQLNASLDTNEIDDNDTYKKQQMITDFENTLVSAYTSKLTNQVSYTDEEMAAYQDYMDALDGIIAI